MKSSETILLKYRCSILTKQNVLALQIQNVLFPCFFIFICVFIAAAKLPENNHSCPIDPFPTALSHSLP